MTAPDLPVRRNSLRSPFEEPQRARSKRREAPMSFQGDVRGIGLAELLQGLSRGRKEGVLTLTARGGHRAVLGMEEGRAWLLPDPDEDHGTWHVRAGNAWPDDPDVSSDAARLRQIVQGGPPRDPLRAPRWRRRALPIRPRRAARPRDQAGEKPAIRTRRSTPTRPRWSTCSSSTRASRTSSRWRVNRRSWTRSSSRVQHADALAGIPPAMVQEIDGNSTLVEIADRLGWPVRQAQLAAMSALTNGGLRPAHPVEVLHLARHELAQARFARALRPGWRSGAARDLPAPWIPGTPRRSPRTGARAA